MTIYSKAASGAAIAMLSLAVGFVGGISWADDTVPQGTVQMTPGGSPAAQTQNSGVPVAYAVLQDGVGLSSTPAAEASETDAAAEKPYSSLAAMVADTDVTAPLDEQARCLATTVFYEARSETAEGQLAVARVVINRAKQVRFGNDLCGVVRQPKQFSFVRSGVIPQPDTSHPHWKRAVAISLIALENKWASAAEGALFFHARRVNPSWSRPRVAAIDNHIFYR